MIPMPTLMLSITVILLSLLNPIIDTAHRAVVVRKEAKQAFRYINAFRAQPEKFRHELGVGKLIGVEPTPLRWNSKLAKVAEERALDMATRDYFDHVDPDGLGPNYHINAGGYSLNGDWIKDPKTNNFESIGANHDSAIDGIQAFIIGQGSPGYMHRRHILGMDSWNASLEDIGIGFVRVSQGAQYKSYLCVLIAKHDW